MAGKAEEIVARLKAKKGGATPTPKIPQAAIAEPDRNAPQPPVAQKPSRPARRKEPVPSHSQYRRMLTGEESFADSKLPTPIEEDKEGVPAQPGTELTAREIEGLIKGLARDIKTLSQELEALKAKLKAKPKRGDSTVVEREEDLEKLGDNDIFDVEEDITAAKAELPDLDIKALERRHPKIEASVQAVAPAVSEDALEIVKAYCKENQFVTQSQFLKLIGDINASRIRLKQNVWKMINDFGEKLKIEIAKLVGEKSE